MGHIETNKCKFITRDDFHKHRAEQQIERDALEEIMGTAYQNSTITPTMASDLDSSNGGISLLDNERVHLDRDWQGNPRSNPTMSTYNYPSTHGDALPQGMSDLSLSQYPALTATPAHRANPAQSNVGNASTLQTNNGDLLDIQEEPEVRPSKPRTLIGDNNVWGNNRLVSSQRRPQRAPSSNLLDTASSINLLDSTISNNTAATKGTRQVTNAGGRSNLIPPAAQPENQDPNARFAQVQTQAAKPPILSRLDLHRYWDGIQGCYICPSSTCGKRIYSPKAFEEHLISDAHIVGKVQCPSCLKKFKTTTALVAHAESGSIKCDLRNSAEYDLAMRTMTAGLIKIDGTWRDGSIKYDSVPVNQW